MQRREQKPEIPQKVRYTDGLVYDDIVFSLKVLRIKGSRSSYVKKCCV